MRFVKRNGTSKAAAERALKAALVDRRAPMRGRITPETRLAKVAEVYFEELERAVDNGDRSPGTPDTHRTIYRVPIEPLIGNLRVREATAPALDRAVREVKQKSASRARTAKVVMSGIMGRRPGTVRQERVSGSSRCLPGRARCCRRAGPASGTASRCSLPRSGGGATRPTPGGWRAVREEAEMSGLVSHHLRKTVATFLDEADVSTRKISDQLGHARVSMTQDRYLGRRLTDRQTAEILDGIVLASRGHGDQK